MDMQTLHARGHPAGADALDLGYLPQFCTVREIPLVRALVLLAQGGLRTQALLHLPHDPGCLQGSDE
jgi:hypothetical protein